MATLNYVTASDLTNVMLGVEQAQTTDDLASGNQEPIADTAMIEQHLAFAESRAESYLIGYDLPLDTAPPALKYAVLVIAKYFLLTRDTQVSEAMTEQYESVIEWLKDVRDGVAVLPQVDEVGEDYVGFASKDAMVFEETPYSSYAYGVGTGDFLI